MRRTSRAEDSLVVSNTRLHVILIIVLVSCSSLFILELDRALGGNSLSWAYVFEWPLLGAFAVYMWWRVLHPAATRVVVEPQMSHQVRAMRDAWVSSQRERLGREESGDA
jgi:hypothetical protein